MKSQIHIKLFATLQRFMPSSSNNFAIDSGITIRNLLEQLDIPEEKAKLIFIDGVKADLSSTLNGGERVGIFPPVGGG
jgi:molybdopterin converting factor small subunit